MLHSRLLRWTKFKSGQSIVDISTEDKTYGSQVSVSCNEFKEEEEDQGDVVMPRMFWFTCKIAVVCLCLLLISDIHYFTNFYVSCDDTKTPWDLDRILFSRNSTVIAWLRTQSKLTGPVWEPVHSKAILWFVLQRTSENKSFNIFYSIQVASWAHFHKFHLTFSILYPVASCE